LPAVKPTHLGLDAPYTTVTFVNRLHKPVTLQYVDASGQRWQVGILAPDERHDAGTYEGQVLVAVADGQIVGIYQAQSSGNEIVIDDRPPATEPASQPTTAPTSDAHDSPDGNWGVRVRSRNLTLVNRRSGEEWPLTTDGREGDGYEDDPEHFRWSPDSTKLVVWRMLDGDHRKVHLVQSSPPDQLEPKLLTYEELWPGDKIPTMWPHLFSILDHKELPVSHELSSVPVLNQDVGLGWDDESRRFLFVHEQRGNQLRRAIAIDGATGQVTALIEERSKSFLDDFKSTYQWLPKAREIVWMSERDGWNHLYLYDADAGRLKNQNAGTVGRMCVGRHIRLDRRWQTPDRLPRRRPRAGSRSMLRSLLPD
jgi:hypothetical protein